MGFYIYNFKRVWTKGPFLWMDIILTTFWLTAALANLNPVFKNSNILQCGAYDSYNFHLMCQSWISSIPAISSKQKKLTSNRQSVLLKQTLDNPNKPQPVMLETGFKPLMLPIMVDNESQSNEIGSGGHSDRSSKRNSMFDNGGSKRYSLLNIAKKRLSG
ncbi:332_t:CDS:2 [Entrophospora sp. SA101]|nr:332_t:CDS:2 [Entrophospora sp. SA101]CAJ0843299.1 6312_t:CDS:2 [Entrophospora sp. SA101]CAJ0843302.1 6313_t:CDS:2 [Entrophospora sp. SA101]